MEPYQQLEKEWAEFNDIDPAGMVVCSSGTAALHLALEALQLPLGSKVIVPDFTMIACPRAVALAGLEPVFVDCNDRLLMDMRLMPRNPPWPSAVMMVHIYGRRANMEWFDGLEEDKYTEHRTYLIEDLAEAHGILPYYQTDAACYSFYRNKIVAGEEGGAVWFRDFGHARLARSLRSLGFTEAHDFNHIPRGHNYRMSNAHASLVLESLGHYESNLKFRRWAESICERECPQEWRMPRRDCPWVYDLRIKGMTKVQQGKAVKVLNQEGIAARHAFKLMSDQAEFRDCKMVAADRTNGAAVRLASKEVIYLPLTPGQATEDQIVKAFKILREFFPEEA
jgi:perosamine synthetase